MLDRTGMEHSSYIKARKALVARGWLIYEAGTITLDYNAVLASTSREETWCFDGTSPAVD